MAWNDPVVFVYFIAPGLLPTPDNSKRIFPLPESKGIFDPMTIQPGFVIDAQEIWINEKFSKDDDSQQQDSRFKRRGRKPDHSHRTRFQDEESGLERGLQENQEEYKAHHEDHMEPPEKRQMTDTSSQQGLLGPRHMEDSARIRPPPMSFRGRIPGHPNSYSPFRPKGPFHSQSVPQEEHSTSQSHDEGAYSEWSNSLEYNAPPNRRGIPGPRGRGRGFAQPSMPRESPVSRDSQYVIDEDGSKRPLEHHVEKPWRSRTNPNMEDIAFEKREEEVEWSSTNFLPHQRRGPHPLTLRGHTLSGPRRFPLPGEGRGMHFVGNGPPIRQGPPQRPPPQGHSLHDSSDTPHLPEQTLSVNPRQLSKLRGLMDATPRPSQEQWQGDRTGVGR